MRFCLVVYYYFSQFGFYDVNSENVSPMSSQDVSKRVLLCILNIVYCVYI